MNMANCSILFKLLIIYCVGGPYECETTKEYNGETPEIVHAKAILREKYPDVDLNTRWISGIEVHHVQTEDGFILELHRIPRGRHNGNGNNRRVVLIQHGSLQTSADLIINGPNNSLAYQLVDANCDVWLTNYRGNTYSYKHVNLTVKDREYWNYSFHEMGIYDLSASIDYILSATQRKNLYYVGFSWGSTMSYVLLSVRPEYNAKIRLATSLAPAAFLGYWKSPIRFVAPSDIISLVIMFGSYDVIGDENVRPDRIMALVRKLAPGVCKNDIIDDLVCNNFIFLLTGYDYSQRNNSNLPAILARTPSATSSKTLLHTEQLIHTKNAFRMFNYGRTRNVELYGQPEPPSYNLSRIKVKVALIWAPGDYMGRNVEMIAERIPNVVNNHRVNLDTFNHYDFTYAKDAKTLVYDYCLQLINIH